MGKSNKMSKPAAARIQKAAAPKHGGQTPKDSFPARAQRAADKRAKSGK